MVLPLSARTARTSPPSANIDEPRSIGGLFAIPHNNTPGSIAAANLIAPHADTQEARVLAFIESRRELGCTREEIHIGTSIRLASICARVASLIERGCIKESGTRANESGVNAAVLVAIGGVK